MSKPGSFLVQLYTAIKMVVGNHSGTAEYSGTLQCTHIQLGKCLGMLKY